MKHPTFDFYQKRSLGQKVDFTFSFWVKNFRTIFKSLAISVFPFFLICGTTLTIPSIEMRITGSESPDSFLFFFLFIIFSICWTSGYFMLHASAISIVKVYLDDQLDFNAINIWKQTFSSFRKVALLDIINSIGMVLGFAFFIIPGFYLFSTLALSTESLIHEKLSSGQSLVKSRLLIENKWWNTVSFILTMIGMMIGIGLSTFFILALVVGFIQLIGFDVNDGNSFLLGMSMMSILGIVVFILYHIYLIGMNVQYFSLREEKEAIAILKDLETIS